MSDAQDVEVDRNYEVFMARLPELMKTNAGEHALMQNREIVGFYPTSWEAYVAGAEKFPGEPYSTQEVTDEVDDLGFYSHVGRALSA